MQQTLPSKQPIPQTWLDRSTAWGLLLLLATAVSLQQTGFFERDLLNEGGWPLVQRFLTASLTPELSPDFLWLTLDATLVTLAYAVCGTILSLLIGSLFALPMSEQFWHAIWRRAPLRLPWLTLRGGLAFPRGIHELLWGLLFVNIFGLDPLTAVLAISVPFGAIVAKIYSEILDDTPTGPLEALLNSGVPPLTAFLYGLIPQALPNLLSYAFYRLECAIRAAAVLGVIGAGGLGYQILLSVQTLNYNELWTLFYALCLLSGLVDFWSARLRRRLAQVGETQLEGLTAVVTTSPPPPDRTIPISLTLILLLTPFSFWYVQPDFSKIWSPRTANLLSDILQSMYPPRLDSAYLLELLSLSGQTLAMSILAGLFASIGGLILAFPAASNLALPGGLLQAGQHHFGRWLIGWLTLLTARAILLLTRAIPAPIWALVLLFVFFPGILPGAIALGLYNLGIIGRLVAEVIENLDKRPLQALQAQGASSLQLFLYGVLPMTLPRFVAYSLYRWEICIRATVIVGLVGAGGLGRLLTEQLSSFDYRSVVVTLLCYIALTFLVDLISATVRRTLR